MSDHHNSSTSADSNPVSAPPPTNQHSTPHPSQPQPQPEPPKSRLTMPSFRRPSFGSFTPPTTDNVIEILWDVALAFFAVRLALLYAALVAGSSTLLLLGLPHFPFPLPFQFPFPLMVLACSAFWARVVMKWCEVPPVMGFRLAVGGAAVVMVLLAEGLGRFVWCEVLRRQAMEMRVMGGCMSWLGVMAGFGLMPALLTMGAGGKGEEGRVVVTGEGKRERGADE
ncbi:hypothetical protein C8A03DRAFT_30319 [Achaetomium macrosporum]|uniref:Uncharacterized protein n=1 Tax=Achaetomium macrosporum TaxID=79813 RepID=A0AAN7HI80_9PEZI|nr:hypothetical protein C8A03DRAFT_30319 [Achaetomium macrosporum]